MTRACPSWGTSSRPRPTPRTQALMGQRPAAHSRCYPLANATPAPLWLLLVLAGPLSSRGSPCSTQAVAASSLVLRGSYRWLDNLFLTWNLPLIVLGWGAPLPRKDFPALPGKFESTKVQTVRCVRVREATLNTGASRRPCLRRRCTAAQVLHGRRRRVTCARRWRRSPHLRRCQPRARATVRARCMQPSASCGNKRSADPPRRSPGCC